MIFLPFFFSFGSCTSSMSGGLLAAVISVCILIVIAAILAGFFIVKHFQLCCYNSKETNSEDSVNIIGEGNANSTLSSNLIPPLFFTQGVKDPLQQDDLMEKITPQ